jgi:hypothetical protein
MSEVAHFKVRLTDAEITAMGQCCKAYFEFCKMAEIPVPEQSTLLVNQSLQKFRSALLAGPDLVTVKHVIASI